jgi:hypothetical protein
MRRKFISLILLTLLGATFFVIPFRFSISQPLTLNKEKEMGSRILPAQNTEREEEKKEEDSHYIAILKQIREKVDGWLKSINERIEREDVTRLEVRFLEILRNILEWTKEKVDSKLESSKKKKPEKKGTFKETDLRFPLSFKKG